MSDNRVLFPQQPILPVTKPVTSQPTTRPSQRPSAATDASFSQVLQQELSGLKFSNHALQRLQTRNIQLNPAELTKLSSAVDKAAQKGANDSLILMNNLALVVSVKNRTVITALDGASLKDNVFTNIDSAVIV